MAWRSLLVRLFKALSSIFKELIFSITLPWKFKKLKEEEKLAGKWQDEVSARGSVWAIQSELCAPLRLETGPVHLTVFECSRLERDMLPAWALHKSEDSLSLECSSTLMSPRKFSNLFVPAPLSGPRICSSVRSTQLCWVYGWVGWGGGGDRATEILTQCYHNLSHKLSRSPATLTKCCGSLCNLEALSLIW